jgi:hypothetical protein
MFGEQTTESGAAGVSPPWFGNRTCNGDGFRGVGVITFTTRDRMVRHGWLTPAAPVCRWANHCSYMSPLARANRFTATAGLRQPLLVHDDSPLKMTTFAVHKRSF